MVSRAPAMAREQSVPEQVCQGLGLAGTAPVQTLLL